MENLSKAKKPAVPKAAEKTYPRDAQSENYRAQVLAPIAGIPMLSLSPIGWVGAAPLVIPESRIAEVAELLRKLA